LLEGPSDSIKIWTYNKINAAFFNNFGFVFSACCTMKSDFSIFPASNNSRILVIVGVSLLFLFVITLLQNGQTPTDGEEGAPQLEHITSKPIK